MINQTGYTLHTDFEKELYSKKHRYALDCLNYSESDLARSIMIVYSKTKCEDRGQFVYPGRSYSGDPIPFAAASIAYDILRIKRHLIEREFVLQYYKITDRLNDLIQTKMIDLAGAMLSRKMDIEMKQRSKDEESTLRDLEADDLDRAIRDAKFGFTNPRVSPILFSAAIAGAVAFAPKKGTLAQRGIVMKSEDIGPYDHRMIVIESGDESSGYRTAIPFAESGINGIYSSEILGKIAAFKRDHELMIIGYKRTSALRIIDGSAIHEVGNIETPQNEPFNHVPNMPDDRLCFVERAEFKREITRLSKLTLRTQAAANEALYGVNFHVRETIQLAAGNSASITQGELTPYRSNAKETNFTLHRDDLAKVLKTINTWDKADEIAIAESPTHVFFAPYSDIGDLQKYWFYTWIAVRKIPAKFPDYSTRISTESAITGTLYAGQLKRALKTVSTVLTNEAQSIKISTAVYDPKVVEWPAYNALRFFGQTFEVGDVETFKEATYSAPFEIQVNAARFLKILDGFDMKTELNYAVTLKGTPRIQIAQGKKTATLALMS
jgi:hypothetical protein